MDITIQGRQIDLGDILRDHVEGALEALDEKFFNRATFATVTFSREGHGHGLIKTHIIWQVGKGAPLQAEACENSAPLSFDVANAKLLQQLRKQKQRLRGNHHHERLVADDGLDAELEAPLGATASEGPAIVAEMAAEVEILSVSEAVSRLEYHDQPALLFRNASHDGLNMVYRRPDGNVGWVDPIGNHVIAGQALAQMDGHASRG